MLNTDAHNPAIKASRKMTKEQFVRNNRGLDEGQDLAQEFLETLHDRIVANEIKMQPFRNDAGDKSILAYTNPDKQGWLKKEGGHFKAWKDKWFLLKDSCLYYLNKPPVWGGDSELGGHIPLHAALVARAAGDSDQGLVVLEMTNGSMLKTGKIEKRANVMKTTPLSSLRLLASSPSEAQEWASAINANVKTLNDAHRGLQREGPRAAPEAQPAGAAGAAGTQSLPTAGVSAKRDTSSLLSPVAAETPQVSSMPNTRAGSEDDAAGGMSSAATRRPIKQSLSPPPALDVQTRSPSSRSALTEAETGSGAQSGSAREAGGGAPPRPAREEAPELPVQSGTRTNGHDPAAEALPQAHPLRPSTDRPPASQQRDPQGASGIAAGEHRPAAPRPASISISRSHSQQSESHRQSASQTSGGAAEGSSSIRTAHSGRDGEAGGIMPEGDDAGDGRRRCEEQVDEAGAPLAGGAGEGWANGRVDEDFGAVQKNLNMEDDGNLKETLRIAAAAGLELSLTAPRSLAFDPNFQQRLASFYSCQVPWPLEQSSARLSTLHMALAGFTFEPDEQYQDRVVCKVCGLSVGSWEVCTPATPARPHPSLQWLVLVSLSLLLLAPPLASF